MSHYNTVVKFKLKFPFFAKIFFFKIFTPQDNLPLTLQTSIPFTQTNLAWGTGGPSFLGPPSYQILLPRRRVSFLSVPVHYVTESP